MLIIIIIPILRIACTINVFTDRSSRYCFCGSFEFLWLVFVMLSCLLIAALWSPEGKGLTSWLLFVMFVVILLLSHLVSWDRCGT